ncbi:MULTISPECIES: toxin-antitoxin system YwqK family antitoxin [Aequorivita]|uniref:Toxin-antitoxin system YwqK family antitoxin n=1 Tax=Aequorivita iocasae TaxID=2803865 RepID=A0ABX7DQU8_9FLAO|nr:MULTISPECIES: hypothetical protein [Aequorivita]QQX76500.1 hypothetical protein JK629_14425 [Aequorivita iocasae]UCA55973.1 hypothetical protein LDL78_14495 [Aequorivita sp. F7]
MDPIQKKVIRTKEYDIHFYVSLKDRITKKDKEYFWYKTGEIHNSFGGAAGELLHLGYVKYYAGNNLAEKGEFEYGLKTGIWKRWYSNGSLMEESRWVDGEKYGPYHYYNENGELMTQGKYRNNIKTDIWIDIKSKDTTWYRNGEPFKDHPRVVRKRLDSINGKESLLKRIFGKRDSTIVGKKEGFFGRIFKKKDSAKNSKLTPDPKEKKNKNTSILKRIFGKKERATDKNN